MQHVCNAIKRLVWWRRKEDEATLKNIDTDVQLIKEFLRMHIGTTYAAATQQSNANQLSVDMSDWGGLRNARASAPYQQIRNSQRTDIANTWSDRSLSYVHMAALELVVHS